VSGGGGDASGASASHPFAPGAASAPVVAAARFACPGCTHPLV
jgi:hypothetical protein